ncbi:adenylate kinase-domain-containing protein [Staphylotrichum tortipilum]|uniref:Uridylate kinase n=1 Tax=Staphylotrichum tortipilum TaxID=2831512 RepID=A0AAN6MTP8_9PEZI|nr:adenylate kinase-domain-containing protein [Staphylotrichum longicolle]
MAATASGRQAWRQLMRNTTITTTTCTTSSNLLRQQLPQYSSVLRRQASSTAQSSSRRVATQSPPSALRQQHRSYSSGAPPPPGGNKNQFKVWPFVVIIALGSGGYVLLANRRKKMPEDAQSPSAAAFSPSDVTVLFVLGGPGAGKGTQCANLVRDYHFTHLSAGDLLRSEQDRPGSQYGQLIKDCIKNGTIVPQEVTIALLENAMRAAISSSQKQHHHKFLIDGFPRKMDQALKFEEIVCPARLVLFYDCPEAEMERRLLERGKTSGRADDNADSIRKRFRTFVETSMPVVDHYAGGGRVVKVDATPSPDRVYTVTQDKLREVLGDKL